MDKRDPFSGTWVFSSRRSRSVVQTPDRWVQTILIEGEEISVREEIVFGATPQPTIHIRARFDGERHPVSGSLAADHVAYERTGERSLTGTAYQDGRVSVREVLTVSPEEDELCMEYTLSLGAREVSGMALFLRSERKSLDPDTP